MKKSIEYFYLDRAELFHIYRMDYKRKRVERKYYDGNDFFKSLTFPFLRDFEKNRRRFILIPKPELALLDIL